MKAGGHENADAGFSIMKISLHHMLNGFGERHAFHIDEFIFIRMSISFMEPGSKINMDSLITETRRCFKNCELLPMLGCETCLFRQLPFCTEKGVLIR